MISADDRRRGGGALKRFARDGDEGTRACTAVNKDVSILKVR
jgi:hypothetical protein